MTDSRNGWDWDEYRQLVLHELGRLSEQMAGIRRVGCAVTDSRNGWDWDEHRQLVLHELGRLSEQMAGIRDEIHTSERKVMVALEKLERECRDTRDEVLRLRAALGRGCALRSGG